jgi:hypothetical protein
MDVTAPITVGIEVVKRAFFIVVGFFLAKVALSYIGKAVPQVAGLGNWGVLALGVICGGMT